MRWDALFDDLETQWAAARQLDLEVQVNELARAEQAAASLSDAVRGHMGGEVRAVLRNGTVVAGEVTRAAGDWMLLTAEQRSIVVPFSGVLRISGLGAAVAKPPGRMPYTLASALRLLARNRSVVALELNAPSELGVRGVLDRVGADYLALALVLDGASRRHGNHQGQVVVPLDAVLAISSSAENEF